MMFASTMHLYALHDTVCSVYCKVWRVVVSRDDLSVRAGPGRARPRRVCARAAMHHSHGEAVLNL